jgi:hypothetical protein
LQAWDQILRLGFAAFNHQTTIAPTTTTNKMVSFIWLHLSNRLVPAAMTVPTDARDDHDRDHHYSNRRHDASMCETPHSRHSKVYSSAKPPNRFVRRASFIR